MKNRSGTHVEYKLAVREVKGTQFLEDYRRAMAEAYKVRVNQIINHEDMQGITKSALPHLLDVMNKSFAGLEKKEVKKINTLRNILGYNICAILFRKKDTKDPIIVCRQSGGKTRHSESLAMKAGMEQIARLWKDLSEKSPPAGAVSGAGAAASLSTTEVKTDTSEDPGKWGELDPKLKKDLQKDHYLIKNLLEKGGEIFLYTEREPCKKTCQVMLEKILGSNWRTRVYYSIVGGEAKDQPIEPLRLQLIGAFQKELERDRRALAAPLKEIGAGAAESATEVKKTFAAGETAALEQPSSPSAEAAAPLSALEGGAGAAGFTTRAKILTAGEDSESEDFSSPRPLTPIGNYSYIPAPVSSTGSEATTNLPLTAASLTSKEQPKTAQVAAPAARTMPQAKQAASRSLSSRGNPKTAGSSSAPAKNTMQGSAGAASSTQGAGSAGLSLFSASKPKASQKGQKPKKPEPKKP